MNKGQNVQVDLNGNIIKGIFQTQTEEAILIDFFNGVEEWIPKSLCDIDEENNEIVVIEWKAEQIKERLGEV